MTDLERRHRPGEAPDAVPAGVGAAGGSRTAGSGPASGGMAGEETGGEALASGGPAGGGTPANDGSKNIAQARAEERRAMAVALEQEMKAKAQEARAKVIEAEA